MQMYLSKVKIREAMDRQRIKTYTELAEQLGITKINYLLCYPMITIL